MALPPPLLQLLPPPPPPPPQMLKWRGKYFLRGEAGGRCKNMHGGTLARQLGVHREVRLTWQSSS